MILSLTFNKKIQIVKFSYRGHTILGSPPPDTGGLVVGSNLNILENFELKSLGHYSRSAETLEIMVRAFGRVQNDTRGLIKDPLNFHIPSDIWLSKEYGKLSAQIVKHTMIKPDVNLSTGKEMSDEERWALSKRPPLD